MSKEEVILVADDNRDDVLLLKCAIWKAGYGPIIKVVHDGKQVVDYLKGEGKYRNRIAFPFPSIVLLDVKLPLLDGFEVLRWIRGQNSLLHLPVIVMSGSHCERFVELAYNLGASYFMEKPLGYQELVEIVRDQLSPWLDHATA